MRHVFGCLAAVQECAARSEQLMIATDFDGTLCPLAPSPASVELPPATLAVLRKLVRSGRVKLAVLSGRTLQDLEPRVPVDAILAGNHGFEIRGPGLRFEHEPARLLRPKLAEALYAVKQAISPIAGAWVEDKGLTGTVHYRQVDPLREAALMAAVRMCMDGFGKEFRIGRAEKALEIYPCSGWNKGAALVWIRQELGMAGCLSICMGDDETDESMFAVNEGELNIHVGFTGETLARYRVSGCEELLVFLARLADVMGHSEVGTIRRPARTAFQATVDTAASGASRR